MFVTVCCFFFQAEDGIRGYKVTGVQTCALPIYTELRSELYGTAKSIAPEKPFGFHIQQNVTFSPFYSAGEDFTQLAKFSDFLKIATCNKPGGPRRGGPGRAPAGTGLLCCG